MRLITVITVKRNLHSACVKGLEAFSERPSDVSFCMDAGTWMSN